MTTDQLLRLDTIGPLVRSRKRKSKRETARILEETYHLTATWKRVTWRGGVGSWKLMRSGRIRLQIGASCNGYRPARRSVSIIGTGSLYRQTTPAKYGYRYAWCVEF